MKGEGYPLAENKGKAKFYFSSTGPKGTIQKVIVFTKLQFGLWNLAFGDVNGKGFDDDKISNNNDIRKVIQTVANAVHLFLDNSPERKILIIPVDSKRKSLYNLVFRHHWDDIKPNYAVTGLNDDEWEQYETEKLYDAFILEKKTLFLDK